MKKGEIWLIDFNPTEGKEQAGVRPGLVVSGNAMNDNLHLSIVCPLTTKIKNFIGDVVLDPDKNNGLSNISEIMVFQVRTISHRRFIKKIGNVTTVQMFEVISNLSKILKF